VNKRADRIALEIEGIVVGVDGLDGEEDSRLTRNWLGWIGREVEMLDCSMV